VEAVTFLLTAYNQPEFIGAAVSSALAQTYPNLTIIISDDCSTDDTFGRIEQTVAGYSGPHRVIVRRNTKNIAIGHVRDLLPLVQTEFVVLGHGDDLFMPDRVEKQIARMIEGDLAAVACNAIEIDGAGYEKGPKFRANDKPSLEEVFRVGRNPAQLGAILAWRMELFREFPEPDPPTRRIDQIVSFRALLKRGLEMMPEPLVKWRNHGKNRSPSVQLQNAADTATEMRSRERKAWARIGHAHFMLNDLNWWLSKNPNDPRAVELEKGRQILIRRLLKESRDWAALRYQMAREELAEH
jgi:glycosyltransferase involved in cell wall biosynthesis